MNTNLPVVFDEEAAFCEAARSDFPAFEVFEDEPPSLAIAFC